MRFNLKLYNKIRPLQPLIIGFLLIIFLFLNIIISQTVSPLYFEIINDNRASIASFLKKISHLADFSNLFQMNKNIYGLPLERDVFKDKEQRQEMIKKFEQVLTQNPKSAEALYNLFLLYQKEGNQIKASEYFSRAKEIDPLINGSH